MNTPQRGKIRECKAPKMNYLEIYSKQWANTAFLEIQSIGLNVDEFRREQSPPTIRIVHAPTQNFFVFGDDQGGARWSRPGYPGKVTQTGLGLDSISAGWERKIPFFKTWLRDLKDFLVAIERFHSAPDLWSGLRAETALVRRFGSSGTNNRSFSVEEQSYIAGQLKDLKAFIVSTSHAQKRTLPKLILV